MSSLLMAFLLPIVLFLSIHFQIDFLASLKPISLDLHTTCLHWFEPPHRSFPDLSRSFICGQKVTQTDQKSVLQKSGLYHAIVVSGGHFVFLESTLKWLAWPRWLRFIALGFYFLMTGLQAPGLRCLMQMVLTSWNQTRHQRLGNVALCFYSGLACLLIATPLWTSLSFWLSFSVALALSFSQELKTQKMRAFQLILPIVLIYLFLVPFNFTQGYAHPLNLILGMLWIYPFCLILLTSAALMITASALNSGTLFAVIESMNKYLFWILEKWTLIIPAKNYQSVSIFYFWFYLFCLVCCFHLLVLAFRRETIHE